MAKIKMIATLVYEYEADPIDYPAGMTPEEMASLDSTSETADIVAEFGVLVVTPA